MNKFTSLCGCLLLTLCLGMTSLTPPMSAEAAEREKVILDADMVDLFDDGVVMMMLAESPKMDLKGVTIVIGNTWVETGTASTIRQLEGHRAYRYSCIYGREQNHPQGTLCQYDGIKTPLWPRLRFSSWCCRLCSAGIMDR